MSFQHIIHLLESCRMPYLKPSKSFWLRRYDPKRVNIQKWRFLGRDSLNLPSSGFILRLAQGRGRCAAQGSQGRAYIAESYGSIIPLIIITIYVPVECTKPCVKISAVHHASGSLTMHDFHIISSHSMIQFRIESVFHGHCRSIR